MIVVSHLFAKCYSLMAHVRPPPPPTVVAAAATTTDSAEATMPTGGSATSSESTGGSEVASTAPTDALSPAALKSIQATRNAAEIVALLSSLVPHFSSKSFRYNVIDRKHPNLSDIAENVYFPTERDDRRGEAYRRWRWRDRWR